MLMPEMLDSGVEHVIEFVVCLSSLYNIRNSSIHSCAVFPFFAHSLPFRPLLEAAPSTSQGYISTAAVDVVAWAAQRGRGMECLRELKGGHQQKRPVHRGTPWGPSKRKNFAKWWRWWPY